MKSRASNKYSVEHERLIVQHKFVQFISSIPHPIKSKLSYLIKVIYNLIDQDKQKSQRQPFLLAKKKNHKGSFSYYLKKFVNQFELLYLDPASRLYDLEIPYLISEQQCSVDKQSNTARKCDNLVNETEYISFLGLSHIQNYELEKPGNFGPFDLSLDY